MSRNLFSLGLLRGASLTCCNVLLEQNVPLSVPKSMTGPFFSCSSTLARFSYLHGWRWRPFERRLHTGLNRQIAHLMAASMSAAVKATENWNSLSLSRSLSPSSPFFPSPLVISLPLAFPPSSCAFFSFLFAREPR